MEKDYSLELAATELGQIRERDHNRTLELVARALIVDDGFQHPVSYRTLSQEERDKFIVSGNRDIEPTIGGRPWAREHFLLGNLGYLSVRRGTVVGHLTFSLLSTGDALIVQVQGRKGMPFTPDKRTRLIQASVDFASGIGVNRLFLVPGSIVNAVREIPRPEIEGVYSAIARENGFTENLNGIPYRNI